jgi:hypothetical protein
MGLAAIVLLTLDGWLLVKRTRYIEETNRLRAGMTDFERRRTDVLLASDQNRFRVMVELVRRQAQVDKDLHLAISVDSATMLLEREAAVLRQMRIELGPEKSVGTLPDTVRMTVPRGTRTIERVLEENATWEVPKWVYTDRDIAVPAERALRGALGPSAVILNGGTVIYSMPTVGPLNDSAYVLPGSVRARASDLKAIAPNLRPGMTVYIY